VVGEHTGEQQQGRDGDEVAGQHPLECADVGIQITSDGGDRNIDHVRVEEPDRGREHRRGDQRNTGRAPQREHSGGLGAGGLRRGHDVLDSGVRRGSTGCA
jgi:hypothetical protein